MNVQLHKENLYTLKISKENGSIDSRYYSQRGRHTITAVMMCWTGRLHLSCCDWNFPYKLCDWNREPNFHRKKITNYNLVSKPSQTSKFETQYTWNALHLHATIEKSTCNQFVFLYIHENTFWTDAKNSVSLAWLIECCGLSHRWSWEFIWAYFHYASNTICYWNLGGMGQ